MAETVMSNAEVPTSSIPNEVQTGQTPPDPAPAASSVSIPENWKEAIPSDIRDAEVFKLVNDIPTLAKNYLHAQKAMGSDKIAVPSKHATPDDWRGVFKKLGLPESADKYELDTDGKSLDEGFVKYMKSLGYENNLLPNQLKGIVDGYAKYANEENNKNAQNAQVQIDEVVGELKKEYGEAFSKKIETAKNLLKEVGGEDLASKISQSQLGNNPDLIRFLVKTADLLKDDPIKGEAVHGVGAISPAEALQEMSKLRADGAFLDKEHPNHGNAVAQMNRFAQVAYPE